MANLMDGLLAELNRNRKALRVYESIPTGVFGALMIRQSIARAEQSISSGDVVQMLASYKELQETKL